MSAKTESKSRHKPVLESALARATVLMAIALGSAGHSKVAVAQDVQVTGVWHARKDFGPQVNGPLELRQLGNELTAAISGYTVPVVLDDGEVRFEIPGDRGYFRGSFSADRSRIVGHWVQPWAYVSIARMASPVTLTARGPGYWSGTVSPLHDEYNFYLVVSDREGGGLTGFIRNPEANIGRFYPIDRITQNGNEFSFVDARGRERLTGTYDPEFGMLSVYIPFNGGTFDFVKVDADPGTNFRPSSGAEGNYTYRQPVAGQGWETATPAEVGMSVEPLEELIRLIAAQRTDAIDSPYIHGFLVARHGRLVLEEYFHGFSRHVAHGTRSASKTVTATLAGVAQHEGYVNEDTPVYATMYGGELPDDLDTRAGRMQLRHLMSMSSGLACDDWDPESPGSEDALQNQEEQPDWYQFMLDLPMIHEPGEHGAYCSGGQSLTGGVISRATGEWLPGFFLRHFATPLGMGNYHWNLAPDGEGYGGGGLYILPRDFLKLGQLFLDDGVWDGNRLLDHDWITAALTGYHELRGEGYGYGWWLFSYEYEGREVAAYYAGGNGGQYSIFVPELDLNIVIFAGNYNQSVQHESKYQLVQDYVVRAVRED